MRHKFKVGDRVEVMEVNNYITKRGPGTVTKVYATEVLVCMDEKAAMVPGWDESANIPAGWPIDVSKIRPLAPPVDPLTAAALELAEAADGYFADNWEIADRFAEEDGRRFAKAFRAYRAAKPPPPLRDRLLALIREHGGADADALAAWVGEKGQ